MNFGQLEKKQKIIIILAILAFASLFVILSFLNPANQYGAEISINNYDQYTSNLPTDRRRAINRTLYNIVKDNLKSSDDINVKDAAIRKGSAKYNYDKSTNINSGSFIVDMPSIKQSYLASYEWSNDPENNNLSGYSTTVSCLPSDKLKYGDFNCKDDFDNSENRANRDPIMDYLPYSTFNYTVTANQNNNKTSLDVAIVLYSADTRDGGRDASISRYKTEVLDWIKSIGLDPNNYIINYSIR